jgi:hypothetical protein
MTTDNCCFYLKNRLIQTSQTGGQRHSDTSLFSIPWLVLHIFALAGVRAWDLLVYFNLFSITLLLSYSISPVRALHYAKLERLA